jgi:hypothetical protein
MRTLSCQSTVRDGVIHLELRFKSPDQIFDNSNTSPLPDRELSEFAEESITDYTDGVPLHDLVVMTIALPEDQVIHGMETQLPEAVRRHFAFRIPQLEHSHRLSLRYGKRSLMFARVNAAVAVPFLYFTYKHIQEPFYLLILFGLVMILNWVTIWDTYEYFVNEYRKQTHILKVYKKIMNMPVRVALYRW